MERTTAKVWCGGTNFSDLPLYLFNGESASLEWRLGTLADASDERRERSDDLSGRVFSEYPRELGWCRRMRLHPRHKDACVRTLETQDGRLVGQIYVIDRDIRVDSAILRMGGIAAVGVDPAFRKRGLASLLMEDALRFMVNDGYDLSLLFSIPVDFYTRFGYRTVLPEYHTTVSGLSLLHRLRRQKSVLASRAVSPADWPLLRPLYELTYRETPGSCVRDDAHWQWLFHQGDVKGIMAVEQESVRGYALYRFGGDQLIVHEVASEPTPLVHDTLLRSLARVALSAGVTTIRFDLPPDQPFARLCLLDHEAVQTTSVPWKTGGMARLLRLPSTLMALAPVLSQRLRESRCKEANQQVIVETDIGGFRLRVAYGVVGFDFLPDDHDLAPDVVLPQDVLIGLIFGLYTPSHLWELWGRPIEPDVAALLAELFPMRMPQVPWQDHF